jgi:hypothetical protein
MAYWDNKAALRQSDPDTKLLNPTEPQKASNQVQFTKPAPKTFLTKDVGNIEQSAPTTHGLNREDLESAIALAPKRRLNIKLPANY